MKLKKPKKKRPSGPDHYAWKGDDAGYRGIHDYMTRHKPKPALCETCGKRPPTDLACIAETYTRNEDDYLWICRSCHHHLDGRIDNLKEYGIKK